MPAGLAMVGTVLLIWLVQVGWERGTRVMDDLKFGYPRTTHYDVVLGHDDSPQHPSHVIALNLRGNVQVIELPGGEASQARIYTGPQLVGEHVDLAPVQLEFVKRHGKPFPDMKITCNGIAVWFRNEQGRFVPQ
ncbi:MAG: hypothetical protein J2P37_04305 [Ktedonobacteraceae bacterium]|nr:hypothetical protein [Ktedonobacteraceae bacterium]